MTDMREAVARAIWEAGANATTAKWIYASHDAKLIVYQKAAAALSLMQPEIDRRVAEERAKLLERLREPSEGMLSAGGDVPCDDYISGGVIYSTTAETRAVWQAMLAQFEKGNSHEQG